jgi:hypothetical protein
MKPAATVLGFALLASCASVRDDQGKLKIVGDLTKGVSAICPLHHKRMTKTPAVVMYGWLPSQDRLASLAEYNAAKASRFPFGETVYVTSKPNDVIGIDHVLLYVCDECLRVGDAWRKEWRYGKKE